MNRLVSREDVFNDDARLRAVARLRDELGLAKGEVSPDVQSPLTIGIELEITWRDAFPELADKWPLDSIRPNDLHKNSAAYKQFSREYNDADKNLKPILKTIQKVIPRVGNDAYWEFSFLPSKNVGVTIAELETLFDAGILRDGSNYSLHMTVGGIDNDRDAYAFLCGLEQAGGSSPERIKAATNSKKGAWARKGTGGIHRRRPDELMGDDTDGYEFRTLTGASQRQLEHTLLTAAQLATIKQDDTAWSSYRSHIDEKLVKHDLELKTWGSPHDNPAPWLKYVKLLEEARGQ